MPPGVWHLTNLLRHAIQYHAEFTSDQVPISSLPNVDLNG